MPLNILDPIQQGLAIRSQRMQQQGYEDEQAKQAQIQDLIAQTQAQGLGSDAYKKLISTDLSAANKLKGMLDTDDDGMEALFKDTAMFKHYAQADPTGDTAKRFLQNRVETLNGLGRNSFDTQELLNIANQDMGAAMGVADKFLSLGGKDKSSPSDVSVGSTVYGRDSGGNPQVGTMTFDKRTRKAKIEWADGGGIEVDKLSESEKSKYRLDEARKKAEIDNNSANQKQLNKTRQDLRLSILKDGRTAKSAMNDLNRISEAIDLLGTGKMQEAKRIFGSYIPGVDPSDAQFMQALLNKGVFPVLANFPGALSDTETAFAKETVSNLGNTPEANKMIINHQKRALQDLIDKQSQFDEFAKGSKEYERFEFTPVDFMEKSEAATATPAVIGDYQIKVKN